MAVSTITLNPGAVSSDGTWMMAQAPAAAQGSGIPQTATTTAPGAQAPSVERANQAIRQVNEAFAQQGQNLSASIETDKVTGFSVVKIRDTATREVISQYPSKAIIALADALTQAETAKGRLLNVSA